MAASLDLIVPKLSTHGSGRMLSLLNQRQEQQFVDALKEHLGFNRIKIKGNPGSSIQFQKQSVRGRLYVGWACFFFLKVGYKHV